MEIKWSISNLDRLTDTGYVFQAHWTCTAVDGDFSASIYATCGWSEGQPVTPYASLTQETVLGWVWASGVDKNATEAAVTAQIEAQKNPVQASGLPW
jgi:hypothetical protein